jgi:hypothetical protein
MAKADDKPGDKPEIKPAGEQPPAPPGPLPAATSAAAKAAPEKKTPAEWAAQLGHKKPRDARLPQSVDHVDPSYAVADKLYGWSERAYHFQGADKEFLITEATYRAALRTAPRFPATELTTDALTPEAATRLAGFKPKTNLKAERAKAEAAAQKAEAKKAEKA